MIIKKTLADNQTIYMNFSVARSSTEDDFQPEREGVREILTLAKWRDVQRIMYISSIVHWYQGMNGFEWWPFDIKKGAIDKIKRSGIPHIIFYPSTFMDNYTEGDFIKDDKALIIGKSRFPNWLIASDDYARWVVTALEKTPEDANREFIAQGPEGFTLDKAAELCVEQLKGKGLKKQRIPLFLLKAMGAFDRKVNFGARIIEALNNYPEKFMAEETWRQLGEPKIAFKEFLAARNEPRSSTKLQKKPKK